MKTGMGLALIGIGAILAFAVTTNTSVFNLHTAGYVIMLIGILGLAIPRRGYGWVGRRLFVRQARVQAGLPAPGAFGSPEAATHLDATRNLYNEPLGPRPGETEIVEDVYED